MHQVIDIAKIQKVEEALDSIRLENVRDSIKEQGLLHPITVQQLNGSEYILITGKYRLQAYAELGNNYIPAEVKTENLTEFDRRAIHLHENLKRAQLPWYEEVQQVKELHDLRQKEHGAAVPSRPAVGSKAGWGVRDTAEELGKSLGSISLDLNLAKIVQQNPSLRNIKDKTTAIKVVKQTAKRIFAEEEAVVSGDVPFADEIYFGDASSILAQLPDNSFDFCITDPPWFKFAKQEDPSLKYDEFTLPVFKELFRVMKFDSFLYLFAGDEDFRFYKDELPKQGWKVQGSPLIWHKEGFLSRTGMRGWEHGRDLELILLAVKGKPVLTSSTQLSSVFKHKIVPSRLLKHPNEKPVELISDILRCCSYVGSLGIDPFAGSGAHLDAMDKMKRHYVGIERDHDRYKDILKRMKKERKNA